MHEHLLLHDIDCSAKKKLLLLLLLDDEQCAIDTNAYILASYI